MSESIDDFTHHGPTTNFGTAKERLAKAFAPKAHCDVCRQQFPADEMVQQTVGGFRYAICQHCYGPRPV